MIMKNKNKAYRQNNELNVRMILDVLKSKHKGTRTSRMSMDRARVLKILKKARIDNDVLERHVDKLRGGCHLIPTWNGISVKQMFGVKVFRLWSRFIKKHPQSFGSNGKGYNVVVQTSRLFVDGDCEDVFGGLGSADKYKVVTDESKPKLSGTCVHYDEFHLGNAGRVNG
jgi:hypothetical protein